MLAAAQLAYISATVVTAVLFLVLAAWLLWRRTPANRVWAVLGVLTAASALSVALYYRDFLRGTFAAVSTAVATPAASRPPQPGPGRVDAALVSWLVPIVLVLVLLGLRPLLRRAGPGRDTLVAALVSSLLVGLLRLRVPVIFGYVHLALFLTPLVCVTAASGLRSLAAREGLGRYAAAALGLLALGYGFWLQGHAWSAQLGRVL